MLVEIIALSRKRIEMRISIARMEALGCLAWLSVSAASLGYEECPLTYDDLHYLKVKLVPVWTRAYKCASGVRIELQCSNNREMQITVHSSNLKFAYPTRLIKKICFQFL